jgi:hypothetical protein
MRRTVCRECTYVEYREPFQMRFLQAASRSIPLFRADFLHSTSKSVEVSPKVPIWEQIAPFFKRPGPAPVCSDSELIAMALIGECRGWHMETELLSCWKE